MMISELSCFTHVEQTTEFIHHHWQSVLRLFTGRRRGANDNNGNIFILLSYKVWCSETRVSLSPSFNTFNRLVFVQCSTEEVNRQTVEETETWSMRRKVRAARLMVTCVQYKAPNIWESPTGETWLLSGVCRGSSLWQLLSFTDTLHLYETNRRKSQTYFWLSVSLWSHCSLTFVWKWLFIRTQIKRIKHEALTELKCVVLSFYHLYLSAGIKTIYAPVSGKLFISLLWMLLNVNVSDI